MEKFLLNSGLSSSSIDVLIKEGFNTVDDLLLLDDWSFNKLDLPLQQMLLLRNSLEIFKRPRRSSATSSYTESHTRRGSNSFKNQPVFADSQFLYPETPKNEKENYFDFEEETYWPRGYHDDRASTVDLLSDSEMQNQEDLPPDYQQLNDAFHHHSKYFTLPTNTSQSRYGMGRVMDSDHKKLKYGSLDKSQSVNFEIDDDKEYLSRQAPISLIQHQYKHLFDRSQSDVSDSEPSTPRNNAKKQQAKNTLMPPSALSGNNSRRSSANDIFDIQVNLHNLSQKELEDRRIKFREKYQSAKPSSSSQSSRLSDESKKERRIRKLREMMESKMFTKASNSLPRSQTESDTSPKTTFKTKPLLINPSQSNKTNSGLGDSVYSPRLPGATNSRNFSTRSRMLSSTESVRSSSSRYSNASGYFTNCEHEHVIDVLDKIRARTNTDQPIPALIVDLNEVDCMYVEEGCLYLTPKDEHNDDSPRSPTTGKGLESLFMGMGMKENVSTFQQQSVDQNDSHLFGRYPPMSSPKHSSLAA